MYKAGKPAFQLDRFDHIFVPAHAVNGLHFTADLVGCAPTVPAMVDAEALRAACLSAVSACGLTPVGELFHSFAPRNGGAGGVTGVVLLAESHLAVHTWPELGAVTLDVFVCNLGRDNAGAAQLLLQTLEDLFLPAQANRQRVIRGELTGSGAG